MQSNSQSLIERIVVVVVILVVNRQLAQAHHGKLERAAAAHVRIQLERAFAISVLALGTVPARLGQDAIEPGWIGGGRFCHELDQKADGENTLAPFVPVPQAPARAVKIEPGALAPTGTRSCSGHQTKS